jgi:large subunit ribosomal protein L10Ae
MSKLPSELLNQAVDDLLAFSQGQEIQKGAETLKGKQRKFVETVELQVRTDPPEGGDEPPEAKPTA